MVSAAFFLTIVGLSGLSLAQQDDNAVTTDSANHECGWIVNATLSSSPWWLASQVYSCLTSIPFNAAVATRFISYYKQTVQFHSTVELLKSPPPSYKQPPVDLIQGLNDIQSKIDGGSYVNQYAFEHELQSLVLKAHDAHLALYAGALAQFSFGSLYDVNTLSEDGKTPPKIYIRDDDLDKCLSRDDCAPTAIDTMNGIPVVDFLSDFAVNQSYGLLERHADWNQLMLTPALIIQGGLTTFGGAAPLYPGDSLQDWLNITLKNHDSEKYGYNWLSLYNSPGYTGPLETGGDFYNFYVLGLYPASYNQTDYYKCLVEGRTDCDGPSDSSGSNITSANKCATNLTSWNCVSPAYPNNPIVWEDNLGPEGSGIVTGYMENDTAVLSLPSFDGDFYTYTKAVAQFFQRSSNAKYAIVYLQQNSGGQQFLALDVYHQFFPNELPFTGSRMRASSAADAIGDTFNSVFKNVSDQPLLHDALLASEWTITDRINSDTGQLFNSWAEYFGPLLLDNDNFTLTQEYNLTDDDFDYYNLDGSWNGAAFNTSVPKPAGPWAAENIIILTDGLCSSSCSYFVELMMQRGARTVVVGGRPESGPMQVSSGRGAAAYASDELDLDITAATYWNASPQTQLPVRGNFTDTGMQVYFAGFNLRDQVRKDAQLPNQLLYFPADCRIYWSFKNYNNYSQLWHDAWNAIYNDSSLCIGVPPNDTETQHLNPRHSLPRQTSDERSDSIAPYVLQGLGNIAEPGVEDSPYVGSVGFPPSCDTHGKRDQTKCQYGTYCQEVKNQCGDSCKERSGGSTTCSKAASLTEWRCLTPCMSGQDRCGSNTNCGQLSKLDGGVNASGGKSNSHSVQNTAYTGYCVPQLTNWKTTSCQMLKRQWAYYDRNAAS